MLKTSDLYQKYIKFNEIMLEEHTAVEIAAIMSVQALTFYRTCLNDVDYDKMIKIIYDSRHSIPSFNQSNE